MDLLENYWICNY